MDVVVTCASCGRAHAFSGVVPFRAECEGCTADLHSCATCRFHDRYVENECREDQADPVAKKDRRNLCEYWKPRQPGAAVDDAAAAKAKLAALFGGVSPPSATTPTSGAAPSAADEAKRKLEELFKKKP
jgi:hypothetical protein